MSPASHPDDPNMGTPRDDKFYEHSIPSADPDRENQPGMTSARPGTLSGGASEMPTTPTAPNETPEDEASIPHDMSSDMRNPQHGEHRRPDHPESSPR